jgi:hypothetical protein
MTDKEFISKFKEISITKVCEEANVNYHNIMSGRAGYEATSKVAKLIADKICDLLNARQEFMAVDFGNNPIVENQDK